MRNAASSGCPPASTASRLGELDGRIDVFDRDGRRLPPEEYPLSRALRGEDVSYVEVLAGPAGGPYRDLVVRARQILGPQREVLGAVAALSDVTAERAAVRALAEEHRRLDAILSATPDYTYVTDVTAGGAGRTIYSSPAKHLIGHTAEEVAALAAGGTDGAVGVLALTHPDDRRRLRAQTDAAVRLADGEVIQVICRGRHADGTWRWLNHRLTPCLRDAQGRVAEILAVVRDVTDIVDAQQQLLYAARHDYLTGLPNRALVVERLHAALGRAAQDGAAVQPDEEVAVLFCDLDGFKAVNDTGGHAAGDAVLIEVARRLSEVVRGEDLVARVGGDEFVVVVEPWGRDAEAGGGPPASIRELAIQVADRIVHALRRPIVHEGVEHVVTASIGIAYAAGGRAGVAGRPDADAVLYRADTAMYRAKDAGRTATTSSTRSTPSERAVRPMPRAAGPADQQRASRGTGPNSPAR